MACVAFRLFLWRVSPSGCFHSVCRLYQAVFTACVAFQLAISGVCRFHSSLIVSFIFCSPFGVHRAFMLLLVVDWIIVIAFCMESRNIRPWNCNVLGMRVQDLYSAHKFCHLTPLLAELHWLPVRSRIHYKILLITFKILHGLSPKYLSDLISIQQPSSYHFRRNDNGRLLERLELSW